MRKKVRNIIFTLMIIVFAIFAPWLVLRIQGIRFDFNQKKFVETGGIFVNVLNPTVKIYLDGKLEKTTNFISRSAFIKNLLPKNYQIEVKKKNYIPWQKTLSIEENKVTEIKNIVLFKENPGFEILTQEVEDFLISQTGKELLIKKNAKGKWKFLVLNLITKEKHEILSEDDLKKEKVEIKIVEWNSEQKQTLFAEKENPQNFLIVNYKLFPQIKTITFSLKEKVKKINFNPIDPDEIFFLKKNGLFRQNLKNEKTENLFVSDLIWFEFKEENLFWLTPSGFLVKSDLTGTKKEILNKIPFPLSQEKEFKVEITKRGLFLKIGQQLYRLKQNGQFEKIASNIIGFKTSPDLERLSFWQNREIWLFQKNTLTQEENSIFLCRFSEPPKSIFWLTPHYLLFKIGQEIKITEIDNRDYLNLISLGTFKNPKMSFNIRDKKLYLLTENKLFFSGKLVP
ncbi:hypothetical protein J7K42_02375 [bacterium]|nr:hypothetical protein [bacterium]